MSDFGIYVVYPYSMDNKLQKFLNSNNCFFIHYASDGFYTASSPAPKISCIIILNNKKQEKYKFNIQEHTSNNSLEQAEREMLEHFKTILEKSPDICFIHWNMMSSGFGFKAIRARAKELGVEIPQIKEENLFDLSSYVEYLAGKKLSVKQILWFNSLLYGDDFLDGKTEAEYFKKWRFDELLNSVDLKVQGFADVVKLIGDNKLKTEPQYRYNGGLTKEERQAQAFKIAQAREKMLNDIYEHNKRVQAQNERILEKFENFEPEYIEEDEFFFFDSAHPWTSLFASWFGNLK